MGTHGVPARYGGFETLADFLCQYLADEFDITVYCNAHKYPDQPAEYHGAKLKYIKIEANGFKGIFYDLITYVMALPKSDIILYLSPVGSGFMTPLKFFTRTKVLVNHGGLNEWEREKLTWFQQRWAKFNHMVAARYADVNIVDNELYRGSLKDNFDADSIVIRYGGDHANKIAADNAALACKYPFVKERYAVSVVRAQLDNNIHLLLEAFENFNRFKLVVVSNWEVSSYGRDLKKRYSNRDNMILLDAIYAKDELDFVRGNGYLYIHSHSRCGTAPSLVEAMSLGQAIISFDVATNRETTEGNAFFFTDAASLERLLRDLGDEEIAANRAEMKRIARSKYRWEVISRQYRELI
ncbi:DUF1972 domain-containing protein [uncultured Lamprocystis sp.]|uniref:DUF1972 domain-containing protein n=1 Tax=uncultured Lamprocystis sp. TaxID=543132 RepID=UPI0025E0A3F5|nr:DUF1972 domain-containing protein [uncultured Lamprocystis sp.]